MEDEHSRDQLCKDISTKKPKYLKIKCCSRYFVH